MGRAPNYCRASAACVLSSLWEYTDVDPHDWLSVDAFLHDIWGSVVIEGGLVGLWRADRGVPQGGALSQLLFQLVIILFELELRQQGTVSALPHSPCCEVKKSWGIVALLGFVDDLVLTCASFQELRAEIRIAEKWSLKIGMK